jgi:hypothetical protein
MTITFECIACETDFDLEIERLVDKPLALKCPACGNHPPAHRCHALAGAVAHLATAMANVRKKLRFEITLETDELPPPHGPAEDVDDDSGLELEDEGGDAAARGKPKRGAPKPAAKKGPLTPALAPIPKTTTVFDDDDLEDLDDPDGDFGDDEDDDVSTDLDDADDEREDDADDEDGDADDGADEPEADDADDASADDDDDDDDDADDADDDDDDDDDDDAPRSKKKLKLPPKLPPPPKPAAKPASKGAPKKR